MGGGVSSSRASTRVNAHHAITRASHAHHTARPDIHTLCRFQSCVMKGRPRKANVYDIESTRVFLFISCMLKHPRLKAEVLQTERTRVGILEANDAKLTERVEDLLEQLERSKQEVAAAASAASAAAAAAATAAAPADAAAAAAPVGEFNVVNNDAFDDGRIAAAEEAAAAAKEEAAKAVAAAAAAAAAEADAAKDASEAFEARVAELEKEIAYHRGVAANSQNEARAAKEAGV